MGGSNRNGPRFLLTKNAPTLGTFRCNTAGTTVLGVRGIEGMLLCPFRTVLVLEEDRRHEFSHKAELTH